MISLIVTITLSGPFARDEFSKASERAVESSKKRSLAGSSLTRTSHARTFLEGIFHKLHDLGAQIQLHGQRVETFADHIIERERAEALKFAVHKCHGSVTIEGAEALFWSVECRSAAEARSPSVVLKFGADVVGLSGLRISVAEMSGAKSHLQAQKMSDRDR